MIDGMLTVARDIAAKAPLAVTGSKRLVTYGRDHGTADTLEHVTPWIAGLVPCEQVMDAARATPSGARRTSSTCRRAARWTDTAHAAHPAPVNPA